jgi:glucose/arabinose dehydrogenase
MAFTNDGYLIVPSGDGGANAFGQDRFTNAQDPTNIMGSVLRIDPLALPNDTRPVGGQHGQYRIDPANWGVTDGNPSTPGETMAFGVRSPYRVTVDRQTNEIYLGDVGEDSREEIDHIVNGGNYGWGAYEGSALVRPSLVSGPSKPSATPPLFELYHNLNGQSESVNVVGGFVYRGNAIPALRGKYVFADTGENEFTQPTNVVEIYYSDPNTTAASTRDDMFQLQVELPSGMHMPDRIWSVAEGADGELYLLIGPSRGDLYTVGPGETDGAILKLVAPSGPPNGLAGDINQDGFVNDMDVAALKAGWYTTGWATPSLKYTHGDLNLDGITDLKDLYLLHTDLLAAGNASGSFSEGWVPEPSTAMLLLASLILLNVRSLCSYRRDRSDRAIG